VLAKAQMANCRARTSRRPKTKSTTSDTLLLTLFFFFLVGFRLFDMLLLVLAIFALALCSVDYINGLVNNKPQ
jgi:hypothetical protein